MHHPDEFDPPPTPAERLIAFIRSIFGPRRPDGLRRVEVGDPRFDDWPVVRDFGEIRVARAWCQQLEEMGIEGVLTSDWPLDKWGRGDIALRVPPGRYVDAEELLAGEGLDEDPGDPEHW